MAMTTLAVTHKHTQNKNADECYFSPRENRDRTSDAAPPEGDAAVTVLVPQRTESSGESDKSTGLMRQTTEGFVPSQDLTPDLESPKETVGTITHRSRKTNAFSQETTEPQGLVPPMVENPETLVMPTENPKSNTHTSQITNEPEEHQNPVTNHFDQRAARERLSIPLFKNSTAPTTRLSVTSETSELRRLSLETDSSEMRILSLETNSSELRKISQATTDDSELRKISFPTDSSELRKLSAATDDTELRKLSLMTDSSEGGSELAGRVRLLTTTSSETTFHLVSPLVDEPDDDTVST